MRYESRRPAPFGTFDQWMHMVDSAVEERIGLSVYDLPDASFSDWYEDGVAPATAAKRAIRRAGGEW